MAIGGKSYGQASDGAKPLVTSFGVCTSYKNYDYLREAGYGYVEENTRRLLKPDQANEKVVKMLDDVLEKKIPILACNGFLPGSLKSTGPKADHEAVLKYADVAFKRAKKVGVKAIVFGSSGSRKIPSGFSREQAELQFVSLLKKMAPLADAQGVQIWLEPLNRKEDNLINTQMQGASIIEKVGHPSLGMVCDIFHVARNEESPEDVQRCVKYVRHSHVAEKAKRTAPGVEKYDFKPYLRALKAGGYSGSMSMECGWKNMRAQAATALNYLQSQIKSI